MIFSFFSIQISLSLCWQSLVFQWKFKVFLALKVQKTFKIASESTEFSEDIVTFAEEIFNGENLIFCAVGKKSLLIWIENSSDVY